MTAPIQRHVRTAIEKLAQAESMDAPVNSKSYRDWKWEREELLKSSALALREAIEIVAYSMLLQRNHLINGYEVVDWQPRKIIQLIRDLADDGIIHNSRYIFRPQASPGEPNLTEKPAAVIDRKGVKIKQIDRVYNKLGKLMHIAQPKKKADLSVRIDDHDEAIETIKEAIEWVQPYASASDGFMHESITVECMGMIEGKPCNEKLTRPDTALKKNPIVSCPVCKADHIGELQGNEWYFNLHTPTFPCSDCGQELSVPIDEIAALKRMYERQRNPVPLHEQCTLTKHCESEGCSGVVNVMIGITYNTNKEDTD